MRSERTHDDDRARTFLSGPTVYLRGIESGDAEFATSWFPSPFPMPREIVAQRIERDVPGAASRRTNRMVACRHGDQRPIASIEYAEDEGFTSWLSVHADPLLGEAGEEIEAEMLAIVIPWLLTERDVMAVWMEIPSNQTRVVQAALGLGMRAAYRLREAHVANGQRHDLICYEALHPVWLARLGRPEIAAEGSVQREMRPPVRTAPRELGGAAPPNAFAVGPRLYLRPIERADADELAHWYARETEFAHDHGRDMFSPVALWHGYRANTRETPPTTIRFAIVTLDGELVIGTNGIIALDWIARTGETETEIVRPDYRSAGYGTEAKHLLLDYAFERLGLHMVRSYSWAYNERSVATLVKQGYRVAGGLSWTGVKNAEFANDVVFDLLAEEWRRAAE